mmetsp:Transcript_4445/g.14396  ORF Transcript_4445/g.14396 Transcript_4445/m.14396 type:complete len:205 (+) Transcript_4445:287-901(+)
MSSAARTVPLSRVRVVVVCMRVPAYCTEGRPSMKRCSAIEGRRLSSSSVASHVARIVFSCSAMYMEAMRERWVGWGPAASGWDGSGSTGTAGHRRDSHSGSGRPCRVPVDRRCSTGRRKATRLFVGGRAARRGSRGRVSDGGIGIAVDGVRERKSGHLGVGRKVDGWVVVALSLSRMALQIVACCSTVTKILVSFDNGLYVCTV